MRCLVLACFLSLGAGLATASEFPDRECCDPVYPLAAVSASISPDTPTPQPRTTSPGDERGSVETLNCLLARQLCFDDPSCSPILETVPRVCGPESVSCSTVTVTKCQAALRTLQAFPFFDPTCLCREPQLDHECNSFRNFLFDHPCIFVIKKEKDPFPIDALPTCNHALAVCQKNEACSKIYEEFKLHCKVREGKCHAEDRDLCLEAWGKIRLTPMFGCICPNNQMKKRCDRVVSLVNHNPCLVKGAVSQVLGAEFITPWVQVDQYVDFYTSLMDMFTKDSTSIARSGSKAEENSSVSFQNTCDEALAACRSEQTCRTELAGVVQYCSPSSCRRDQCMHSLQAFYRRVDQAFSLEIAFCLCNADQTKFVDCCDFHGFTMILPETDGHGATPMLLKMRLRSHPPIEFRKTKNPKDECLVAQELLHPICAQQPENNVLPTCHSLALTCMDDSACRGGLENYAQMCAVDAVTKQCAGPPEACRTAMLEILGTALRSNCACKGTDFSQLFYCMGWQRVLWFNPCVVESQRDFHARKMTTKVVTETSLSSTPSRMVLATSEPARSSLARTTPGSSRRGSSPSPPPSTPPASLPPPTSTAPPTTHLPTTSGTTTTSTTTTSTTTTPTTTTSTTTEKPPSTTQPRYCVAQKPDQQDQFIAEGDGKRLYREGEPDCSEVCLCRDGSLTCNTVCVERKPCQTDFAFYNHAAPAYQAYRGRCLCYSGRFICMRPPPDTYDLKQGVFLFLGYSELDEQKLKSINQMEVQDAIASLQDLLRLHIKPKTNCTLMLYNSSEENVILVGKVMENSTLTKEEPSPSLLTRQKAECEAPLQEISEMINSHDPIVHSHMYLSIFKTAEVEVVHPIPSSAASHFFNNSLLLLILPILLS